MKSALGVGFTRGEHEEAFNQMYVSYAHGKDVLGMKAVVGEESLTDDDQKHIDFLNRFATHILQQGRPTPERVRVPRPRMGDAAGAAKGVAEDDRPGDAERILPRSAKPAAAGAVNKRPVGTLIKLSLHSGCRKFGETTRVAEPSRSRDFSFGVR
jgi:hypothetical protein